jgi:pimeloyl-ACP methyl ester carboxylesterase
MVRRANNPRGADDELWGKVDRMGRSTSVHAESGKFVEVDGLRLHVVTMGTGSPTVVFDSGAGTGLGAWSLVQPQIATRTLTVSFDRGGVGQSDIGKSPRSAGVCADELHALLSAAGIPPPYLLVGHSQGCFHVRMFAARHRDEVAAVVLVEPGHEDANTKLPEVFQQARQARQKRLGGMKRIAPVLRLLALLPLGSRWMRKLMREMTQRNIAAGEAERAALDDTYQSLRSEAQSVGDIPLLVLGAERAVACFETREYPEGAAETVRPCWLELLRDLAARSTRGELRMVPGTGHMVPLENPTAVTDAIVDVLGKLTSPASVRSAISSER